MSITNENFRNLDGQILLKNVSSPAVTVYIKELNISVLFDVQYPVTNYFSFSEIAKADSLGDAINNDQIVIIQNGVTLSKADSLLYFASSSHTCGEANTVTNVGSGAGWFKAKVLKDLEFKKVNSTELTIVENASDITLGVGPVAISGKASVTPAAGMEVLLNDSGTLKKGNVATFLGGASADIRLKGNVLPCGYGTHTNTFKSITLTANYWYGVLFWVGGQMNVTHIGLQTGSAVGHDIVGGIYKYVYASDSWTKVDQVGPFAAATGMQAIALSSTATLAQGVYMMAMLSDGAQADVTGHYVQYLQNMLPAFHGASQNTSGFYLYNNSYTYTATLPATIASGVLSVWPYTGHTVPSCYLTLG